MPSENGNHSASIAPRISVVIPVLNEAERINFMVSGIRSLSDARLPIEIIVSDGSTEADTLAALRYPDVVRVASRMGRAKQMNAGAAVARGSVLLFLHADTRLPEGAFQEIVSALENGDVVAGAFELGIDSGRALFRISELYVSLRTRFTRIPFGDQAIFISTEYFRRMRGYSDIPIMEDVELMKRIRRNGDSIRIIPRKVMTSPRRWEREGVLYGLLRNWTLQFMYLLGVPSGQLAKYYSNKKDVGS